MKLRSVFESICRNFHEICAFEIVLTFVLQLKDWGVSAVTVIDKTTQNLYILFRYTADPDSRGTPNLPTGNISIWYIDWKGFHGLIPQCSGLTDIPVIGSGDIYNYEEYYQHMESGRLATCMIGRFDFFFHNLYCYVLFNWSRKFPIFLVILNPNTEEPLWNRGYSQRSKRRDTGTFLCRKDSILSEISAILD